MESVTLRLEGHALPGACHIDLVRVEDEDDRRQREDEPRDSEHAVQPSREQGESGSREVAGQGPLVVLPPDGQGRTSGAQGDNSGQRRRVGEEIDRRGDEGGDHLRRQAAVLGRERQEREAGDEGREDVVAHVEDDLDRVAGEASGVRAGGRWRRSSRARARAR